MPYENWARQEPRRVCRLERPKYKVSQPRNFEVFIRNLHRLLPEGSWLFLEGGCFAPEVRAFLTLHQPLMFPAITLESEHHGFMPWGYHVPVREDVLAGLADFARTWREFCEAEVGSPYGGQAKICDHLKAYKDNRVIVVWCDVGAEVMSWFVDACIAEDTLQEFCRLVGSEIKPLKPGDYWDGAPGIPIPGTEPNGPK